MSALIAPGQAGGKALLLGSYSQGLEILTTSLTTARVGQAFSQQLIATPAGTTWGINGQAPGLTVGSTTGLLSGTPTAAGSFSTSLTINHPTLGSTTVLLQHLVQAQTTGGKRWKPRFWRWFWR